MAFGQYLKDTQGELRHVAWPTRFQTIIYTVIVIAISVAIALYLGFFDYIFTTIMSNVLEVLPEGSAPTSAIPVDIDISTSSPTN